jgi:hypothetical protein
MRCKYRCGWIEYFAARANAANADRDCSRFGEEHLLLQLATRGRNGSVQYSQPDDSNQDQIKRDDIIQKPRHYQNQNTSDQRDDWLNVSNA